MLSVNTKDDLITLFIDLTREKDRQKFYDVRIESLEIAVKQINTMYKQIQINYNYITLKISLKHRLVRKKNDYNDPVHHLDLLNHMIELLKSVKRKERS